MARNRRVTRDTIRSVAVTDEVARCRVPRECFGYLSGDPLGGRISGHVGPDEPSPLETQDDQPIEKFEPDRRNDEQIDSRDVGGVIAQEGPPAQTGRATTVGHVPGDSGLRDIAPELQQLAMNAWRAPERVIAAHCPDQIAGSRPAPQVGRHDDGATSDASRDGSRPDASAPASRA